MGLSMKLVFILIIPLCPCLAACPHEHLYVSINDESPYQTYGDIGVPSVNGNNMAAPAEAKGDYFKPTEVSKACYGVPGLSCTRHNLRCSSGRIVIQEAFYMENSVCLISGISACVNINFSISQIPGTRYNFSDTELDSLFKDCSLQSTCSVQANRSGGNPFSTIKYQCINASSSRPTRPNVSPMTAKQGTTRTLTIPTPSGSSFVIPLDQTTIKEIGTETDNTTTPITTTDKNATLHKDAESNTGTVVGIIVPLCIIMAGVVTAVIIFRRRKLRQKSENGKVEPNPQEVYSLEKKFSPEYDYATANEYLDLVPQTHTIRSPQYGDADGDHYHQVEPLQTKAGLSESNHSSGNKKDKLNLQSSVRDCPDGNYHELEPQTELGSSEYNLASKMESHNVKTQPGKKGSSEYALAGNISKGRKEFQQVKTGSSDYDYTGGNTYHVLERQSALRGSSDYAYAGGNDYHEVNPQESNTSDYYYATCGNQQANHSSSRNTPTRHSDNHHFGCQPARANGHYDKTSSVACPSEGRSANEEVYSYNHLNEKAVTNTNADSTYNTTASTRHKMDSSTNDMEDDYGYNHLGTESKKNLPQNDYDTTASAIRDLARMNGDMEDSTYDHAHLLTSNSSPSGMTNAGFQESDYDHASTTTAHKDEYESNASPNRSHQDE